MTALSVYIAGVGGQGVGLTAEVVSRAVAAAGHPVSVSDTHGLAQRGGMTVSHLHLGDPYAPPLISPHTADTVIALERLEALRGAREMLRPGGVLIYCDAVFQPASVRVGNARYPEQSDIDAACLEKGARAVCIETDGITDPKMYNTMLLARLTDLSLLPGVTRDHILTGIAAALPAAAFSRNRDLFLSLLAP